MCYLDGVAIEVQTPCCVAHQRLVLGSFFVIVAHEISSYLTIRQQSQIVYCKG